MADVEPQLRFVRFADFEVDLRTGELRKNGVKLKFSGQPFQVLAILLEHPGFVVTREELQKRLWPDTFVDVDRNLNTAVNKIREVLGDSAESPRFVETLPRRGYRFIGEMQTPVPPADPLDNVEPVRGLHRRPVWLKIGGGVFAVSVIVIAALVAYRWHRPLPPLERGILTAVPFTALPGMAVNPAFSPDGSRIAFVWSPAPETNGTVLADLYVKALGSETLLRLTQHASAIARPAWSPDGTQIAFFRGSGADSGIYVVPALGGPEQKLYSDRIIANLSWSPDGKWIAFAGQPPHENHSRIYLYLLSMETLATRQIPENPKCFDERFPTFSHNGGYLAYWCFQTHYEAALYIVSPSGGKPKMVTPSLVAPWGLAWSADDTKLIYSNALDDFSTELVEVTVTNGSAKRLGLEGIEPAVAPRGDKLAYSAISGKSSLLRRDLLHPEAPAVDFIPSSRAQYDAQYSPDGKRIVFASHRSGVQGVWISNEDGSDMVQISDPRYRSGSPRWSPDGSKIVFDAFPLDHWEIYVADVAERKPRKLITNIFSAFRPNWSRDGKWIYFASQEPGSEGVYRCPALGGVATAVSKDIHGLSPQESFDGSTAYFASYFEYAGGSATLKKVQLPGQQGSESEVDPSLHVDIAQNWTLSAGGIYFVPADAPNTVRYFEFASRRIRTIFVADHDLGLGLSVSPDGRWILYSQETSPTGDIMLVDHFH